MMWPAGMKLSGLAALATLVACTLGACALGPDYAPPPTPPASTGPLVEADAAMTRPDDVPTAWWRLYDDPVLDGLIADALAANDDLKVAAANLAAARAIAAGARSGLYPRTDIVAGGIDGRDPITDEILELNGHKPFTTWLYDAQMDASYEVDLFGHVQRSIEAAEGNRAVASATQDVLRVSVAAETARSYGQICALNERLAVAERALAVVTQERQIIGQRHDAGGGSNVDVLRAEEQADQTAAAIPLLKGQRRASLYQLTALLGRPPSGAPPTIETCARTPRLAALMPVGDGAALLRRRPDIRRADRALAVAIAREGVATADLYPRISLNAFYGGVTTRFDQLATENALAWGIGPSISWSFPNLTGPLARLHMTEANADAALAGFNAVVLDALKETEQALATYRAGIEHRVALTAAQQKAQRAFAVARAAFDAGAISLADRLIAEQRLIAADAEVAAADATLVQEQIAVFKALGGGWQGTPEGASP